ncbi:MAG: hypothetical protein QXR26_06230 [Candidatus Caldarchaeum sp.]
MIELGNAAIADALKQGIVVAEDDKLSILRKKYESDGKAQNSQPHNLRLRRPKNQFIDKTGQQKGKSHIYLTVGLVL